MTYLSVKRLINTINSRVRRMQQQCGAPAIATTHTWNMRHSCTAINMRLHTRWQWRHSIYRLYTVLPYMASALKPEMSRSPIRQVSLCGY